MLALAALSKKTTSLQLLSRLKYVQMAGVCVVPEELWLSPSKATHELPELNSYAGQLVAAIFSTCVQALSLVVRTSPRSS